MSGFYGFDRELLFGAQKKWAQLVVLLGSGGRQVKRSIWRTGWASLCVVGGGEPLHKLPCLFPNCSDSGSSLHTHHFSRKVSGPESWHSDPGIRQPRSDMDPCPSVSEPLRLTRGSGSLAVTWFLFGDTGQRASRWFTPQTAVCLESMCF